MLLVNAVDFRGIVDVIGLSGETIDHATVDVHQFGSDLLEGEQVFISDVLIISSFEQLASELGLRLLAEVHYPPIGFVELDESVLNWTLRFLFWGTDAIGVGF
jgi:hypothetical protein